MFIKKFIIEKPNSGLSKIELNNLKNVVALIGKNGSGKSRILELVRKYPSSISSQKIKDFFEIEETIISETSSDTSATFVNGTIIPTRQTLRGKCQSSIKYIENDKFKNPVKDSKPFIIDNFIKSTDKAIKFDIDVAGDSIIRGIQSIADNLLYEDYLIHRKKLKEEKSTYYKYFSRFRHWIDNFLGTDIDFVDINESPSSSLKGDIVFDKFPYKFELLSPGQRILFAYAFYISLFEAREGVNAEECIYIIDEPELHLHPDAQVKLIKAMRNVVKDKGQLWISTHSIHILSALKFDEIYLVKEGTVSSPNRYNPGFALDELMGIKENTDQVNEFISDTSKWAETNFAIECLTSPQIFAVSENNDPEISLALKKFLESGEKLGILDFGAGKGRLGTALMGLPIDELRRIVNYSAFEPYEQSIVNTLAEIPINNALYTKLSDIPKASYNVSTMIGVLHEIDVNDMEKSLNALIDCTIQDGVIVVVEDLYFPRGERPNKSGYFVFNSEEIRVLFNCKKNNMVSCFSEMPNYHGRIQCTMLYNDRSLHVNKESIIKAIDLLANRCLAIIENMDVNSNNVADGRKYAFYCQQYINCVLFSKSKYKEAVLSNRVIKPIKLYGGSNGGGLM